MAVQFSKSASARLLVSSVSSSSPSLASQ
jgi:hypothetical protein